MKSILNFFLILTVLFLATNLKAQDSTKIREFGIGFRGLNNYDLLYQWGKPKLFYRISAVSIGFSTAKSSVVDQTGSNLTNYDQQIAYIPIQLSFGINFAVLKAKSLTDRFDFIYGGIIGVNVTYSKVKRDNYTTNGNMTILEFSNTQTRNSYRPNIGVTLGARYKASNRFFLYAEIAPNIFYSIEKTTDKDIYPNTQTNIESETKTNSLGISDFTNSGASLAIMYRITK